MKPADPLTARSFFDLFESASRRQFDVVVFWALDRFTREGVLPTLQYLNRLSSFGVAFKSFTQQYIDSCGVFKDAIISIMATVAAQEKALISERTKAGLARVRAKGVRLGRRPVVLDSSLIRSRRASGLPWRAIARELGVSPATCQKAAQDGQQTSPGGA